MKKAFNSTKIRHCLACLAMAAALLVPLACQPSPDPEPVNSLSWEGLSSGETVYGIVLLAVKAGGDAPSEIRFFVDGLDEEDLLGVASQVGSEYVTDWYACKVPDGAHLLYAVAEYRDGTTSQVSAKFNVKNPTRASAIPASAIKLTPENDPAPPQLAAAFKDLWYDPVPLEGPINTAGAEDAPFISPDGNTFYFWFNGDQGKDVHEQVDDPATGIWCSQKVGGEWQEPERVWLQYFNEIGFDGAPTLHGSTLWFCTIRAGNYRDLDMWTAVLSGGVWTNWSNPGELLNQTYNIGELHVSADGNEIYFGSARSGGMGSVDIWVTRRVDEQWLAPENIAAVNTSGHESHPFLSQDGNELWFTRPTPGPTIYRSVKVDGQWQEPQMIVGNLAGEPTLDEAGNLYFTHHRWDDILNRATEADIYVCYRK